jgi:hypothetical protein
LTKHDSVAASEENDATEARDDKIRRSVPSAAGSDHQPQARTGAACGRIDWDFIDGEIAPLYSDKDPARDPDTVRDRAVAAQTHLRLSDEGHLGRCDLKGRAGDAANAILSAIGYNFRCILAWLRALLRLFMIAILRLLISRSPLIPAS